MSKEQQKEKNKEVEKNDEPLKIDGTLDDVLKVSIPKPKAKE